MAAIVTTSSSRYRRTPLLNEDGLYFYGPYIPPTEFDQAYPSGTITHLVSIQEVGFLDKIAVRYYGPGNEGLWWAICRVNGIIDVETDMWPGLKLTIPTIQIAKLFLAENKSV